MKKTNEELRNEEQRDEVLIAIAKEHIYIEGLDGPAPEDFNFEVSTIWWVRRALEAAYEAGQSATQKAA